MLQQIKGILNILRLPHTLFSLPFAGCGMVLGAKGWPSLPVFFLIIMAVFFARTCAMLFNRILDRNFDRSNPRTAQRELAKGSVSLVMAWLVFFFSGLLFFVTCYLINSWCFYLAPIAFFFVCFYSLTKRFTRFSHFFLGLALAIAPVGAFLATTDNFHLPLEIIFLSLSVLFWVAGFDIIYATMDEDFDRANSLYSIPEKYGFNSALKISGVLHCFTVILLLALAYSSPQLGYVFLSGIIITGIVLVAVHLRATGQDIKAINDAFFNLNVWVGIITFIFIVLDVIYV
ncbi:4-hydroxybenzoate octaprenyltransferase [Candidatus Riflebacteria bacterium]